MFIKKYSIKIKKRKKKGGGAEALLK